MAKIEIEFECGCFKRSGYDSISTFPTLEEARQRADDMIEDMNESFCGAHRFEYDITGETITIRVKSNF